MERVRRPRISTAEKTEVWTRWKHGESLSDIGRALDRVPGAIFHVLAAHGGVAPPQRTRSWLALTLTEREGNLTRPRPGLLVARDQRAPGPGAVDHQP